MKLFSLYRVELRRLLFSKIVLVAAALSMLSLLLGNKIVFYTSRVMSDIYILIPILTGTTIGAILWAVVAMMESDRLQRNGVHILTDAIAPPTLLSTARTLALLTISMFVTGLIALFYLPYTAAKMSYLFSASFYFANFMVFMLPTWWISILFADAFYRITQRVELSAVLYIVLAGVSVSGIASSDYFLRWINPFVITYSDGFASIWPLRIGLYTRIIWLCIALCIWLLSILCIRKYQRSLAYSLLKNITKISILLPAVLFAMTGVVLWYFQPFIDHGPNDYIYPNDDIEATSEIHSIRFSLHATPVFGSIDAKAEYDIQIPYDGEAKLLLNPGYKITNMTYDGENVPYRTVDEDINGDRPTYYELPKDKHNKTLVIEYSGLPTVDKYQSPYRVTDSVDRNYISLSSTALFPKLENYFSTINSASVDITIPGILTPFLNNIQMTDFIDNGDGTKTWKTKSPQYIQSLTAGDYCIDNFSVNNLNIDFAYGTAYKDIVTEYNMQQTIIDILTYCSEHYGELWSAKDNHLLLQQQSSMYMGGYALPGVSTWFETVLAPDTLRDPDKGANATEVFIHEMIHQWWGGLGLNCKTENLWSSEGLTVYSTYRLIKEKYGALYAQQYYVNAWQDAVENQDRSFYNRHPEYLELLPQLYQTQIKTSNQSINHYYRMPLMILKAEELVGGEDKMDDILWQMYADKDIYQENGFSFNDFLSCCGLTEEDLSFE